MLHRTFLSRVVLALVVVALGTAAPGAQAPQQLFQQALVKERAEGALNEAIALYQRVVKEAGTDRALAARALVQLGGVYEKLGSAEAKATYERVVREFADQRETASAAMARLAAIAAPARTRPSQVAPEPVVRLVDLSGNGVVSPDGQWLLIGGGPDRALRTLPPYRTVYIRHAVTGETRVVDTTPDTSSSMPVFVWSQDSKRVAYNHCYVSVPPSAATCELKVADIGNARRQVLYPRSEVRVSPIAWQPDGRAIAATFSRGEGPTETTSLGLVALADGAVREVKILEESDLLAYLPENVRGRYVRLPEFSPDGQHLVISRAGRNLPHDIFLVPIAGGPDRPLVQHPADDRFVAWTAGGGLLFRSDRGGTIDLWLARIQEGSVVGLPHVVKRDIGSFYSHGLTSGGTLYYQTPGPQPDLPGMRSVGFVSRRTDIHVATLDPSTGSLTSTPAPVAPTNAGRNMAPTWSPDGRFLIYRTNAAGSLISNAVTMLSLETGVERHVRPDGIPIISPQATWLTPDGRFLVVFAPGGGPGANQFAHRVDVLSGSSQPIGGQIGFNHQLLADGRSLAFLRGGEGLLAIRDLETGQDRNVYTAPGKATISGLAFSADGTQAAFRQIADDQARLMVYTVATGQTREVLRLRTTFAGGQRTAWSPDSRFIYFVEEGEGNPDAQLWPHELWRVAAEGGSAQKVLTLDGAIWNPAIHPNGRYLAFASEHFELARHFALDHFLPDRDVRPASAQTR